jgi:hypothetical protein
MEKITLPDQPTQLIFPYETARLISDLSFKLGETRGRLQGLMAILGAMEFSKTVEFDIAVDIKNL